jgi:signal peptidase I
MKFEETFVIIAIIAGIILLGNVMKFEEILVVATALMGLVWLFDIIFLKSKKNVQQGNISREPIVVEYARSFFPILLIVLILRSFLAEPFRIPSGSMKPGLIEGDHILVNKFSYGVRLPVLGTKLIDNKLPQRGDVIVFRHNDRKDLIKRVIGLPGDHILYKDKIIYINGKAVRLSDRELIKENDDKITFQQTENLENKKHTIYISPAQYEFSYRYANFTVPKDSYFVMGDNRDNSQDSRFWGAVHDSAIIGKAFAIWWSWDMMQWSDLLQFWKTNIRWNRIATKIE